MAKFPSINQFRNVIMLVKHRSTCTGVDAEGNPTFNHALPLPKLTFRGSVKLHGTNAAVVFTGDQISFQSRERELVEGGEDNAGFRGHMVKHLSHLAQMRDSLLKQIHQPIATLAVFGEWCGGNIQKGVALSSLPKMFVVFAVKADDIWIDLDQLDILTDTYAGICCINAAPQYEIEIDFTRPELAQAKLTELTLAVEKRCPYGALHGAEGIGEGIVWRRKDDPSSDYWFKVKGEKHSASKVKTLAAVDVEQITALRDFVESTVTEARLEQGLQNLTREQLKPFQMSSMGDFIRWVHTDILKEEADTIAANGIDPKKLGSLISPVARQWFVGKLNAAAMA